MPEPHDLPIELRTWLIIVTMDLDDAGRAQVREAIATQYAELLQGELDSGMDAREARDLLIRSLCDPWIARIDPSGPTLIRIWNKTLSRLRPPQSISAWLAVATADLLDATREQLNAEFTRHYEDAVEAELEIGKSEFEARKNALAALGDPDRVHAELRRLHLAKSNLRALNRVREMASLSGVVSNCVSLTLSVILILVLWSSQDSTYRFLTVQARFFIFYFFHKELISVVWYWMIRKYSIKRMMKFVLFVQPFLLPIIEYPIFFAFNYNGLYSDHGLSPWKDALGSVIFFCTLQLLQDWWTCFELWRRAGNVTWNEIPPPRKGPDQFA